MQEVMIIIGVFKQQKFIGVEFKILVKLVYQTLYDTLNLINSLAKKIEADFTEYWQFLDEFLDLTSDKGLQRLEDHLNSLQHELARIEESARCQEFDDDDPANNSVFGDELGEMEFFVSKKDVDTPLKAYKGVSDKNNDTEEIRATTVDNGNTTTDENDAVDSLSTPLSPVTFLASALDSLDICSNQASYFLNPVYVSYFSNFFSYHELKKNKKKVKAYLLGFYQVNTLFIHKCFSCDFQKTWLHLN